MSTLGLTGIFAITTLLNFGFGSAVPAFAKDKTLTIPKVASITYPAVVKLADSGCQRIKFRYKSEVRDKLFGYMTVRIVDADDMYVGGAYLIQGSAAIQKFPNIPTLRKRGSFDITVCRSAWTDPSMTDYAEGQVSDAWPSTMEVGLEASPRNKNSEIYPKVFGTIKFTGKFVD
jgi:hypothetical protein